MSNRSALFNGSVAAEPRCAAIGSLRRWPRRFCWPQKSAKGAKTMLSFFAPFAPFCGYSGLEALVAALSRVVNNAGQLF